MKSPDESDQSTRRLPFDWDEHFFGTATVGERGQIVIPADARKRFDIEPGDKLLILSAPGKNGLMLCKLSAMREFMSAFHEALVRMEQEMTDNTTSGRAEGSGPDSQEEQL